MAKSSITSGLLNLILCIALVHISQLIDELHSLQLSCKAEYEKIIHIEGELVDFCRTVIKEEERLYSDQSSYNFSNVLR